MKQQKKMRGLRFPGASSELPDWSTPYGRTKRGSNGEKRRLNTYVKFLSAQKQRRHHPLRLLLPRCDFQWSLLDMKEEDF